MSDTLTIEGQQTGHQIAPVVHTPGPWRFEDMVGVGDEIVFQVIKGADGRHLSSTWAGPHVANARLIAAAPDLLEALKKVVAISDRKHDAWDEAKAAIAKASGSVV